MEYGQLKPDGYIPRIADKQLERMLATFGAVEVAGTMWCGKTWTSLAFGQSVTRIGLTGPRTVAEADPGTALLGAKPHVIDEWQDVPAIWDEVRAAVDASGNEPGSFVLTGSSEPRKELVHHSGAGRIAKLRMRTMTLVEMGLSSGAVSLAGLFGGRFEPQLVQQSLAPLVNIVCKGGWPALTGRDVQSGEYLDAYFDALFSVSIPRRGLNGQESRRVALSLARNLGTAAKLSTVASDAGLGEADSKSATNKAAAHIAALQDLYVIERLTGWDAPIRSKTRLRTKPKRYFADPSLAASLLQVSPSRLVSDGQLFGLLFESLCIHDLAVYASALPGVTADPLHYYRDSDGLEVDAVVEMRDGRWAAFEVKLGESQVGSAAASLNRLARKIAANPAARNPKPEFLAVVVGAGEYARFDKDLGVYILPITCLGA
ncbi:MAG: DUF4143 domain-containing protein [Atopobiaceae bacterium]|nr:DUF4143 domain-containing protein [Atopobiaceae bacterium]